MANEREQLEKKIDKQKHKLEGHDMRGDLDNLELDHKPYKPYTDGAFRDGGNFGKVRAKAHGNDVVMVKEAKQKDEDFSKEAALSQVAHKAAKLGERSRVVPARALGTADNGKQMIVMDLMKNGDTQAMFDQLGKAMHDASITPLEYADAVRYLAHEIAKGVEQIHAAHIVHRDIKPDNVFLDDKMNVKIGDFGLATWEGDDQGIGARAFTAPEQIGKDVKGNEVPTEATTSAVDIHCLGKSLLVFARGALRIRDLEELGETMTVADSKARPTIKDVMKSPALKCNESKAKAVLQKVKSAAPKEKPSDAKVDPEALHNGHGGMKPNLASPPSTTDPYALCPSLNSGPSRNVDGHDYQQTPNEYKQTPAPTHDDAPYKQTPAPSPTVDPPYIQTPVPQSAWDLAS